MRYKPSTVDLAIAVNLLLIVVGACSMYVMSERSKQQPEDISSRANFLVRDAQHNCDKKLAATVRLYEQMKEIERTIESLVSIPSGVYVSLRTEQNSAELTVDTREWNDDWRIRVVQPDGRTVFFEQRDKGGWFLPMD